MSRVIRHIASGPAIYIGEKHLDRERESVAEKRLEILLPLVSVITDPDGAKLIPIGEVEKFERVLLDEREKSRREGYDEGHERGLQEGLQKAREVLQQFDRAIKDAVSQRENLLREAREKVLELVVQISRKVTYDAIRVDPETTLDMIRGVIDSLIDRSRLKIKVHPDHLPIVEQNIDRFLEGSTTIKELTVESDPRVKHGGCFIETPTGDIDARLESQFDVIADTLCGGEVEP